MRKRNRGDALNIPAREWNQVAGLVESQRVGQSPGRSGLIDSNTIWLFNNSGTDYAACDVVQFFLTTRQSAKDTQQDFIFRSQSGTWNAWTDPFCVCLEPIATGRTGRAQIGGVAYAKFAPTGGAGQAPVAGTQYAIWDTTNRRLIPCHSGRCAVLGTGFQSEFFQAIQFGPQKAVYFVKVTSSSTGEICNEGTPPASTGVSVTLSDKMGKFPLVTDQFCLAAEINGKFQVIATDKKITAPASATDLASAITSTNAHRSALLDHGIYQ